MTSIRAMTAGSTYTVDPDTTVKAVLDRNFMPWEAKNPALEARVATWRALTVTRLQGNWMITFQRVPGGKTGYMIVYQHKHPNKFIVYTTR